MNTWQEARTEYLRRYAGRDRERYVELVVGPRRASALITLGAKDIHEAIGALPAPYSYNRGLSALRHFLRFVAAASGVRQDTTILTYLPEPRCRVRYLDRAQASALVAALPARYRPLVRFALATGLRRANCLALTWAEVDLERSLAWVHADQAKAREAIAVPLNREAIGALGDTRMGGSGNRDPAARCFPVPPIDSRIWKASCARAGIEGRFRFHDLRHTWASWHAQAGTPLIALQQLGGWQSAAMVRRYAHFSAESLSRYAEAIG